MRIDGSVPMHIARAYGLKLAGSPHAPTVSPGAGHPADAPLRAASPQPTKISALVAGEVADPVSFAERAQPTAPVSDVLQLYTRAADRIEAATAIQVGRQIDLKA